MVNWENYEEYMLLYADNELNETEQRALLAFVDEHPELRKELDAYKATQLVPDTQVVFTNKQELLKKEEPKRIIPPNKWWMYAAAAAVILFAVVILKQNNTHDNTIAPVAKTEPITKPTPAIIDSPNELHSTPAGPVTIENNIAKREPAKTPARYNTPKKVTPVTQQPQPKHEEYITREEPKKTAPATQVQQPVTTQQTQAEDKLAANQPKVEQTVVTDLVVKGEKRRKGLLAWLPIRKEKKEGLDVLANAVNDKLDKVKNLRDNLKDTDVSVKIGNTELFVVKL